MNKRIFKRIFIAFLAGVLISIWNINPAQSQSIAACASNPACATTMGLTKAALKLPSPVNPSGVVGASLINKVSGTTLAVGGAAMAFGYLTNQDMQKIREDAIANHPVSYGTYGIFDTLINAFASSTTAPYCQSNIWVPQLSSWFTQLSQNGTNWGIGGGNFGSSNPARYTCRGVGSPLPVDPSDVIDSLADHIIAEAATAAAAAAAANPNLSLEERLAAAAAASAMAGLLGSDPAVPQSIKDSAAAAAAAGSASAADAQQQAADTDPSNPANVAAGRINFVLYAIRVFSNKFPFDFFYSPSVSQISTCPAFTFFYYKFEFCFLVPLFNALRWIATIAIGLKMIFTL
ncbi:MAG: hypothetical protein ACK5L1_03745 [Pseudanabaena sp.]|jgi:hypothetical protein